MLKMASLQPVFISAIYFALVFNRIGADSVRFPAGEDDLLQKAKYVGSDSEILIKIQQLETSIVEKTKELKEKDNEIALIQSKITSLQEVLKKSKFVAQSNINEVMEVNGGWLPIPVARYLSDLEKNWKEHGKPSADAIVHKAVEKKAEAVRWAGPHIETIKTKWVPAVKERWLITSANIAPHVQSLRDRSRDAYVASKSAVTPHVLKVQELAKYVGSDSDLQRKIQRLETSLVEKAKEKDNEIALLHSKITSLQEELEISKFVAQSNINKVKEGQGNVQEKLSRSFATKELVWFTASALLALPIIVVYRMCSASSSKRRKTA